MNKTLQYLLVLIILFISNDTITFGTSGNETLSLINHIIYAILIIILLLFYIHLGQQEVLPNLLLITLLLIIFIVSFLNSDFSLGYLIQANTLILGYSIAKKLEFRTFATHYNNILYYLSLISIIFFFLFIFFPALIGLFNVQENTADVSYINLYFYSHFVSVFRNTGIFREPGVYMIYLNIGIIFELFIKNKINNKHIVVFVLTLLTTLSTAGFIVAILIGVSFFLKGKKIRTVLKTLVFLSFISVYIYYNYELFETSFMKFDSSSRDYGSAVARISSITVPFKIFLDNPFLGVGLANFVDLFELNSRDVLGFSFRSDSHSTNTLFNSLATYGIIYLIILLISFYRLSKLFTSSFITRIIIFISFLLILSNQDLRYSLLFSVLLFYGLFGSLQNKFFKTNYK